MPIQFDHDMNRIRERLLTMAAVAESMIRDTIGALVDWDPAPFAAVEKNEDQMDMFQRELDEETVRMIAVHTPVAGNLRLLLMIARITVELERIGDLTIDIDRCAQGLFKEKPLKPLVDLPRMAEIAMNMLRRAIDSFADGSTEKALAVVKMDDMVDNLNDQIVRELMTYVMGDSRNINRVLGLILISRAVERIADHAVNIAEDVVYMVKGEDIRHIKTAASDTEPRPTG